MRAVVVGGGLAGIAAALDLVDAGHEVTLLEARPTLGGAVQTLPERPGDPPPPPDNGQHIALGCCTAYLELLERIGQAGSVRRTPLALPVVAENGVVSLIRPGALALLRYRHVGLRDRVAIGRIGRALGRLDPDEHDDLTFADLLRSLGSSDAAIERFWDVFMRPALNLPSKDVSAAPALFTLQTALFAGGGASDLVLPAAPLGAMHGDAAAETLAAAGATVRTRARATALEGRTVVLSDGERIESDGVVLALPHEESAALLGEPAPALEDSPIVSVHLVVDRQLLRFPLAALLGSHAHWVFDRGRLTRTEPRDGQYLTVVSSGAPGAARDPRPRARGAHRRGADVAARAGGGPLVAGEPRAGGDVRRAPRNRRLALRRGDGPRRRRSRGRVDRDGLAGDDGERRPKRPPGRRAPQELSPSSVACTSRGSV